MKIADVTYTGRMRSHTRKVSSGKKYSWINGETRPVHNLRDAEELENKEVFDVDYTSVGEVAKLLDGKVDSVHDCLKKTSYRQKQKLVKALDLDVKANSSGEKLTEELQPEVEEMMQAMEMQNRR